eukprot:Plantae.Rhodophyta-Hildenbrandia_rubra.ctg20186.p2 GENE.Plantae.Rhodophyta-Hildenbrandia_rubra.ctg20186~~Plantae.Rhodophyta-Hildenbrandia_rubra.ctg20186.p2  ORF type:complete len:330 (+),score=53.35 Plantae.Rhodophyta-Hildenbrandia_rubra.ctg20186:358-1347(+)
MPPRILRGVVLLLVLVGVLLGRGKGSPLNILVRQVEGFPLDEISKEYALQEGKDQCPKTVQFGQLTDFLDVGGVLAFGSILHDGKACEVAAGQEQNPDSFIEVIASDIINDEVKGAEFRASFAIQDREQLQAFNNKLIEVGARYYVGYDKSDRTCSGLTIQPKETITLFIQIDDEIQVPGVSDALKADKQYAAVWQPDDNIPSCVYSADRAPAQSPAAAPNTDDGQGDSGSTNVQGETSTSTEAEESSSKPKDPGTSQGSDGSANAAQGDSSPGTSSAALSTGAIAGIAVGATFGAIAIGAAAFVSYRIYHGRTVPIIPEQLLPGPPSR